MILNSISKIIDDGRDYVVLIDYGTEGISVLSQHLNISGAFKAMNECNYGLSKAILKVCYISDPIEM